MNDRLGCASITANPDEFTAGNFENTGQLRNTNRPSSSPAIKPGTSTSFVPLKQINAGLLNVGYAELVQPPVRRLSFCTVGRMTFRALSTLNECIGDYA